MMPLAETNFVLSVRESKQVRAFTVVELLVVVAIVGGLLALTLMAVQAARKSAHKLDCQNRLRQLSLATQSFVASHQHVPGNGWGSRMDGNAIDAPR